jgi:hypothetical protein
MTTPSAPHIARSLGAAGLLPQLVCLFLVATGNDDYQFAAQALAATYATIIFSFLGGLWWGLAAQSENPPSWLWYAAVMPSLIGFAAYLPWAYGGEWPGPSLVILGVGIMASLLVDRQLGAQGFAPPWWMSLRLPLSLGLGGMTLAIGLLA